MRKHVKQVHINQHHIKSEIQIFLGAIDYKGFSCGTLHERFVVRPRVGWVPWDFQLVDCVAHNVNGQIDFLLVIFGWYIWTQYDYIMFF